MHKNYPATRAVIQAINVCKNDFESARSVQVELAVKFHYIDILSTWDYLTDSQKEIIETLARQVIKSSIWMISHNAVNLISYFQSFHHVRKLPPADQKLLQSMIDHNTGYWHDLAQQTKNRLIKRHTWE